MAYMDDLLRELEARGATGKIYNAGSSSSQNISSTQKKKKKEYTEELLAILSQQADKTGNTLNLSKYGTIGADTFKAKDDDIAPIKTVTKVEQEDDGLLDFFQAGALGDINLRKQFDDGYQFGDVLKTGGHLAGQVGKAILGTAGDVGLNVVKGFASSAEGVADLASYGIAAGLDALGKDASASTWRKNASENTVEEWTKGADEYLNRYSVAGRTIDGAAQGVGQYLALLGTGGVGKAAGLGAKAVSAITRGTLAASAAGSAMGTAYAEGATDGEAGIHGLATGGIEVLTEMLFGGLGKALNVTGFSTGLLDADDVLAKKVSSLFSSQINKNFAEFGIKASAEGLEEVLSGIGQAISKKLTYMKEEELSEILKDENLLEQFVIGATTSGFIQSGIIPGTRKGSLREANAEGRDFITGYNQNEQSVIDKEVEKRVAEQEEKIGKKLTKKEIGKIEKTVQEDMDKGFISIDTIEEVLGGETYSTYKKLADAEEAMQTEYDALGKKEHYTLADDARYKELGERLKYVREKGAKNELRKRLDEQVSSMVEGSRLSESFAERSRRGKSFEADVTQYSEKQRAIVQKAIDSGILNDTRRTHEFVDMVARIGADKGITFDFANNAKLKESGFAVEGKTVNGFVTKDGITVNIQSAKSLNSVVGHEITHVLEGTELYTELQKAVFQYAETKGEAADRRAVLEKLYEGVADANIDAELTADLVGDYLFTDSDFINNLSANHRNVFQKIYDEIKYLLKVATAGSKEARELEKVKRAFEKAYREGGNNKTAEDGGRTYSLTIKHTDGTVEELADARNLTTEQAVEYLKSAKSGKIRRESYVPVRKDTPQVIIATLEQVNENIGNHSLVMQVDKAQQAMRPGSGGNRTGKFGSGVRGHALSAEQIVEIVNKLDEPSMVIYQTNRRGKNGQALPNNVAVFVEYNNNGTEGVAVIEFDSSFDPEAVGEEFGDNSFHTVVTVFEPDTDRYGMDFDYAEELLANPDNYELEIKRRQPAESATGEKHPNTSDELPSSGDIVAEKGGNVKYSLASDSEGRQLTAEQREYFKDSKIVDADGNLKVMYHGSNAQFTVFDKSKAKGSGLYGRGFYFTDSASHAGTYGSRYEVYLDIRNPLQTGAATVTRSQVRSYLEAIAENEDYSIENYGTYDIDAVLDIVMGKGKSADAFKTIQDINATAVGDMVEAAELFNLVNGTSFDGIVVPTETIAFRPEQIKRVDNAKPTADPDIRYSLAATVKYDGMNEADKASAQKVIRSLRTQEMGAEYGFKSYGTYTQERMEREIDTSSSRTVMDYAKSYITWVDPDDFIYATTVSERGREQIKEEAGTLDIERLRSETQPIHLTVDFETGQIVGHEGRHRMLALQEAGVERVAVIIDAWNDDRHHTKPVEFMRLEGQRFSDYQKGAGFYLHDLLPLSKRYADTARDLFTTKPKKGVQFSLSEEIAPSPVESYAAITEKQQNLYQRERSLAERKREANNNPELLQAMDDFHSLFDEMRELLPKRRQGTATQAELDRIEEIKALRDQKLQRVSEIQESLGLKAMEEEEAEIRQLKEELRVAADAAWKREGADRENAAIAKAGVSAQEYFRKKALKAFKTTTNFNEAGYLLPDGKLLNFSGGERNHRYRDHREIGEIYEATQGAEALNRFLNDGNIRIMAESPGIDLASGVEPTAEQYDAIRRFVKSHGAQEGQFFVDFSDAEGHKAGNYAYEGRVNADRVINDIKYYYANGEVRAQSDIGRFLSLSPEGAEQRTFGSYNVYGSDVALEGMEDIAPVRQDIAPATVSKNATVQDAAVYEEPLEEESPYAELDRLTEQAEELERQMYEAMDAGDNELAMAINADLVDAAVRITELEQQLDADAQDRLGSIEDTDAPAVREAPYSESTDTVTLPKKMVQEIARDARKALAFSPKKVGKMRELVEKFSQGEIDSETLYDEIAYEFHAYTESIRNEEVAEVKRWLRSARINVSDEIKSNFPDYTSSIMRPNSRKIIFAKDGADVDILYAELTDLFPGFFPSDIIQPADQLERIIEVANMDINLEESREIDGQTLESVTDDIVRRVNEYRQQQRLKMSEQNARDAFNSLVADADRYLPVDEDIAPVRADVAAETDAPVESVVDKDSFISKRAAELYDEISNLKNGVKASPALGYLLDHGYEWRTIKTALLNIRDWPSQRVDFNSAAESVARETIYSEYEDYAYSVSEAQASANAAPEIKTVKERLAAKLQNLQTELENNQRLREESRTDYELEILQAQTEYNALQNKNTRKANNLLRRIERLRRISGNTDADYAKRISDLEAQVAKANEEARTGESTEEQGAMRRELHARIVDGIRSRFAERGYDFDEVLKKAKDLSTFATVDNIPQRVMEKALGYREGQILADATVNQVAANETEGIRWLNSYTDRKNGLLAQISKQYGIKPGSKESAAAQMYAEGFYVADNDDIIAYGDAELAKDFPDARVQANIKGLARDPRIRQIYDATLAMINESRARNAYPEIQKLDNYFLHFRAMDDTFSRLGIPFNPNDIKAKDLPTDLNGVTADLKPGQPYFASAMHRKGKRTSFDLLGGLEKYLTSAKGQIYHIDDIQTLRALRNHIAETYGQAHGLDGLDTMTEEEAAAQIEQVYDAHLSTFAKFLNEEANVIAGKTALIDRGLEGIIGRRGMTFFDTLNRQVGANMVGFNVSSSLTNFIAPVQAFAKTNKAAFVKGFAQTVANRIGSIAGKTDGFVENNPTMIRRQGADRFYRTPWQKAGDIGYALMGAVDSISTEIIVRGKYNELVSKGMSAEQAVIEADKWTSRLMGDRSLGQMPQLYNSKMLGLITKFQLEVRNQLDSQFYDTIQEAKVSAEDIQNKQARNAKVAAQVASTFVQLAVVQHLFGKAFEAVAGYNPAFDIIEAIVKAFGWDDEEESEDTVLDNLGQGFMSLLEDMPYSSVATGGRIPIASALPVAQFIKGKDQYGNEKSRLETVAETAPYWLLPGGYGQIKKTTQGLGMFDEDLPIAGSYTDSGNLRFTVEDTLTNRVQAAVFGQYASGNARDYFDNERQSLKKNQIQELVDVDIPIREYWDYREGLNDQETLADKFDYIAGLDLPIDKKNILINNVVDRKEAVDLTDYDDYANYEEFDFAVKNPEKYDFLQSVGVSVAEYQSFDDDTKDAYNWAYENPDKYTLSRAVTDDVAVYRQYTKALNDIKADKDAEGKSISGSRKTKVLDYLNNLDADYYTKIILFKMEYNADDTYNREIIEYLNGRNDISFEEEVTILKELGFSVSADGTVRW